MNITAKTEPSEDGHGYVAVVKINNKVVYNSESKHTRKGVFEDIHEAQSHADAWAAAEEGRKPKIEELRRDRSSRLAGEVLVLMRGAADDLLAADKLKKAAKTHVENAEKREARIGALAQHTENPRVRIEWDRKTPAGVQLVVEASDWDEPFRPEPVDSPDQLSLPSTNWEITKTDGAVTRAIGYGRVEVAIVDGKISIVLGADEHRITGVLAGALGHEQATSQTSDDGPAKPGRPVKLEMGKLKDKELRERLPHYGRAETLLGLYVLEQERSKPRAKVLRALADLANDHGDMRLAIDMSSVDEMRETKTKRSTQIQPDRAAAALITIAGVPELRMLDQLVPQCGDPLVIDGLLDDEIERGEASRDEVVTVLRQRLSELGAEAKTQDPDVQDAEPAANNVTHLH